MLKIYFYCPDKSKYDGLTFQELSLAPGRVLWAMITVKHLNQYCPDIDVTVVDTVPDEGIILFHASYRKQLLSSLNSFRQKKLVCMSADSNLKKIFADFHVYQNPYQPSTSDDFYICHWPQAGIIPRGDERGGMIKNLAFKGAEQNLNTVFQATTFTNLLKERDVQFFIQAPGRESSEQFWRDFSNIDLQLAVRSGGTGKKGNKPASKLINGWLAGVPSLLGPESAFQYYRKSELDYIEVSSPVEVLLAIDRLIANPSLYLDMVANGVERAKEFTDSALSQQWQRVIEKVDSSPSRFSRVNYLPKFLAYKIRKNN